MTAEQAAAAAVALRAEHTSVVPDTTLLLDLENLFYWAGPGGSNSLSGMFAASFGYDVEDEDALDRSELRALAVPVLDALASWTARQLGTFHLIGYGKRQDSGVRAVLPTLRERRWGFVASGKEKDAADHDLVRELGVRSLHDAPHTFLIGSSDMATVMRDSDKQAAATSRHRYLVLLGPRLLEEFPENRITYVGTLSELFGREVRRRKEGREPRAHLDRGPRNLRERYRRSLIPPEVLREALVHLKNRKTSDCDRRRRFSAFVTAAAQGLAAVPHPQDDLADRSARQWPAVCLESWSVVFPGVAPGYATAEQIPRLVDECGDHRSLAAVREVIRGALDDSAAADGRAQLLEEACQARLEALGPNRVPSI